MSSSTRFPSRGSTVCAPVDNAGTALLSGTVDAEGEFLLCTYPVAGDCKYFADDGFFSSGSDKLCPEVKASSSTAACAPVDNAGTALLNSTIDAQGESLFCNHPVAGECEYFADDGFFSSGSDKLCPEALSNSKDATTHTSILFSTACPDPAWPTAADCPRKQVPHTPGPSGTARSGASQITTRKGISTRVVAGISVALVSLFINILVLSTLGVRRRRLRRSATDQRAIPNTISPFTMVHSPVNPIPNVANPLRSINAGGITRQQLESELLNAREKDGRAGRNYCIFRGGNTRLCSKSDSAVDIHEDRGRASPDLAAQLQAAREQIDMLVTRIQALEANTDPWGMGMSDQPPPEYV
ncbi:hypothetical protein B0H19DRAFT_1386180 [Mycena capillaripes]|nr:hypothetical protein B0H19DRAFT_1386180 [Mycena capillaripes]